MFLKLTEMNIVRNLFVRNFRHPRKYVFCGNERQFFDHSFLGLPSFKKKKQEMKEKIYNAELYKARLKEYCDNNKKNCLVFIDDIMKMIVLTENDEDLQILKSLIKKVYCTDMLTIQEFIIGPEVMRLYHVLNKPFEAISTVRDRKIFHQFNNTWTCIILLDLLWENELYEEILKISEYYNDSCNSLKNSYYGTLISFCAYFKLNTSTSFHVALEHYRSLPIFLKSKVHVKVLLAGLALKQNHIFAAMEVLRGWRFYNSIQNLKFIALAKSGRFGDIFEKVDELLSGPPKSDFFIASVTMDLMRKEVINSDEECIVRFQQMKETLDASNLIKEQSLDDLVIQGILRDVKKKIKSESKELLKENVANRLIL